MIGHKTYDLIVLANHAPSKWASETIDEYFKDRTYTICNRWRVTNNHSLKEFKRKFKFEDLPCLVVTEHISTTRKSKTLYYGDDIEEQCKENIKKEMRREARARQRESAASLRLRTRKAQQRYTPDVIPAPDDANPRTVSNVCGRKKKRDKKDPKHDG